MAGKLAFTTDSLTNLVSRMGTDRDKAAGSYYAYAPLSDEQLLTAYRTAWLPRKIVDIPAFDGVRAWRDWQAEAPQIEAIEAEEKRLNVKAKVFDALVKARLWGGAAIVIGTGEEDLAKPLDPARVGKGGLRYLTVMTRRHLIAGEVERDPASEWYGLPTKYSVRSSIGNSVDIHPSRLVLFRGNRIPDEDLSGQESGWGDSVLQSTLDSIKQMDGTAANVASLVFEAKVDVIRVPDFMANMGDEGYKRKILERYTLANMGKGINGALMLDKEEEYSSKSASFATLPDVMDRFMQIVSGAADIPATRLLGQAPAGMNATGVSDMKNYHDRLSATQEIELTPAMALLDECLIRSATGSRDAAIYYTWSPLEQMSEKEKADIFNTKAQAARTIAGTGGASPPLMPIEALSDALVNALIEDGSLPGLEAAIELHGDLSEQEPDEDETEAALGGSRSAGMDAADAEPRPLYMRRDVLNGDEIIAWAKSQGFATTLPASDLHVTIAYSRAPVDWMKAGENWSGDERGRVTINPGGPRMMERFGDARVLLFASSVLSWRHESIKQLGASWDHDDYQPHITISYAPDSPDIADIEPYRGKIVLGPEIFEDIEEGWSSNLKEDGGAPSGEATFRGRKKDKAKSRLPVQKGL